MVPRCEDSSINHPLGHLPRLLVLWTERERQRRDAKRAPVVQGEQEIREKEGRLDFQKGDNDGVGRVLGTADRPPSVHSFSCGVGDPG